MKEIIYLDTSLINSYLAQIDEGLTSKMVESITMQLSESEEKGTEATLGANGGLPFIGGKISSGEFAKQDVVYSKTNNDLLEKIVDDYSLDVLLEKLENSDEINFKTNKNQYVEGDLLNIKSDFYIVDFNRLDSISTKNAIDLMDVAAVTNEKIYSQIASLEKNKKAKNNPQKTVLEKKIRELKAELKEPTIDYTNFDYVNRFGKFGNLLFPESKLFKFDDLIAICSNKHLRVNDENLNLYNLSNRKLTILCIVLAQSDERTKTQEGVQLDTRVIASSAPLFMMDIILTNLNILNPNDYYVRPIAIYFD